MAGLAGARRPASQRSSQRYARRGRGRVAVRLPMARARRRDKQVRPFRSQGDHQNDRTVHRNRRLSLLEHVLESELVAANAADRETSLREIVGADGSRPLPVSSRNSPGPIGAGGLLAIPPEQKMKGHMNDKKNS